VDEEVDQVKHKNWIKKTKNYFRDEDNQRYFYINDEEGVFQMDVFNDILTVYPFFNTFFFLNESVYLYSDTEDLPKYRIRDIFQVDTENGLSIMRNAPYFEFEGERPIPISSYDEKSKDHLTQVNSLMVRLEN